MLSKNFSNTTGLYHAFRHFFYCTTSPCWMRSQMCPAWHHCGGSFSIRRWALFKCDPFSMKNLQDVPKRLFCPFQVPFCDPPSSWILARRYPCHGLIVFWLVSMKALSKKWPRVCRHTSWQIPAIVKLRRHKLASPCSMRNTFREILSPR